MLGELAILLAVLAICLAAPAEPFRVVIMSRCSLGLGPLTKPEHGIEAACCKGVHLSTTRSCLVRLYRPAALIVVMVDPCTRAPHPCPFVIYYIYIHDI